MSFDWSIKIYSLTLHTWYKSPAFVTSLVQAWQASYMQDNYHTCSACWSERGQREKGSSHGHPLELYVGVGIQWKFEAGRGSQSSNVRGVSPRHRQVSVRHYINASIIYAGQASYTRPIHASPIHASPLAAWQEPNMRDRTHSCKLIHANRMHAVQPS